jgi:hypothetical protein
MKQEESPARKLWLRHDTRLLLGICQPVVRNLVILHRPENTEIGRRVIGKKEAPALIVGRIIWRLVVSGP